MIVYMCTIMLFSLAWGFYLSFTNKMIGSTPTWVGFKNYITLLKTPAYIDSVVVTIKFTCTAIALKLIFGMIQALVLNVQFPGKNIARALLLIPWSIPMITAALNWRWIFAGNGGAVNYILKSLGIIDKNLNWLGSANLAFFVIVFVDVWRGTPFFGTSIISRLQNIPDVYYEAAEIDGANRFQRFIYITLPNVKNTVFVTTIISTIWTLNTFGFIWNLTGGGPNHTTELMNVYSYLTAMSNRMLGRGLAVSIMAMPVLLVLIQIVSRQNLKTIDN